MVTVTLDHPTIPLAPIRTTERSPETTRQTQVAMVRDADDQPLAVIELAWPPSDTVVGLGEVDDQYWLMTYYFGRGGRDVTLTLTDDVVQARLETCWEGNLRLWWLDFEAD